MKKMFKLIALQFLIINFGILLANGIFVLMYVINGMPPSDGYYSWYFPFSVMACAFITSIPTFIFAIPKLNYTLKIVLHFIVLIGVMTIAMIILGWNRNIESIIAVYVSVLVIYAVVWFVTYRYDKRDEKSINEALNNTKDDD